MRHKWENNKCKLCGISRKRKAWKQLMAIVNHPPWEGYMRGVDWWYYNGDSGSFKRPECKMPNDQNDEPSVATGMPKERDDDKTITQQ